MTSKVFELKAHEIMPVATGWGGCIATDRIVVDGSKVGYMHRDEPAHELDSGWRFLAGDEDDGYMEDSVRHGVYDVNTIANYDPDIVPFLDSRYGSAFARDETGALRPVRADA